MELQHVNVKLLLKEPREVDLEPLVMVFHSWIQEQASEELLLDVTSKQVRELFWSGTRQITV
jgi:predicted thioredoxin/glutaredoxin